MEYEKFMKDLKKLKEGERLILGDHIFYVLSNEYHVYNTHEKIEKDVYKRKDYKICCSDYRYSIGVHNDKKPTGSTWNFHGGGEE